MVCLRPNCLETKYAKEIWSLFEAGKLTTETVLTGLFDEPTEESRRRLCPDGN